MNNKLLEICKALNKFLSILSCTNCNTTLRDLQKFLNCGHILCISCANTKNTICSQCQFSSKKNNSNIEQIIQMCYNITEAAGYRKNVESIERINKSDSLSEKNECNSDTLESKLNLNNSSMTTINLNQLKRKKFKKLKRKSNLNFKQNIKKIKNCTDIPNMIIPKNINKRNHCGETKLQEACKKGQQEYVKYLLKAGADPNISCYANWTPLQESADYGFYEITKMLLESGANVNQPGYEGRTALHEAAKNNSYNIICLLLQYNAKKDIIDNNKKKPVDYCIFNELSIILNCDAENNIQHHKVTTEITKNSEYQTKFENNDIHDIMDKRILKGKQVEKCLNSEYNIKIDYHIDDTENDVNIVFENIHENYFDKNNSYNIKNNKDIFYDSSTESEEIIDIIN